MEKLLEAYLNKNNKFNNLVVNSHAIEDNDELVVSFSYLEKHGDTSRILRHNKEEHIDVWEIIDFIAEKLFT